jgi:hypothetical protein
MGNDERASNTTPVEAARKAYVPPAIRHLGSVRQLTLGFTGVPTDGTSGGLMMGKSTIEAKEDVRYLELADRQRLAETVLGLKLADYRYKPGAEPRIPADHRCLGFIIEDAPADAPFVVREQQSVDVYAFASAILATVQQQQQTILELQSELAELKKSV